MKSIPVTAKFKDKSKNLKRDPQWHIQGVSGSASQFKARPTPFM
jgi:hypothetical protein